MTADDTIFALSSGQPPAAIGILRISGPVAGQALAGLTGNLPEPRVGTLLNITNMVNEELLDQALCLWFPGPNSATGKYLASLDADDFLFPYALELQVLALEADPSLGACTGSLLLFNSNYQVLGRRRTQIQPGRHIVSTPLTTRVPLGSTMLRSSLLGSHRFDDTLGRSEDRDFFDRVLQGTTLEVLKQPTYAYRWSLSLDNVMEGLKNREALFGRRLRTNPVRAGAQIAWNRLKRLFYPSLARWGLWAALNEWRAKPATLEEAALFEDTLRALRQGPMPS